MFQEFSQTPETPTPPYLSYLTILSEFSSKLLKPDKKTVWVSTFPNRFLGIWFLAFCKLVPVCSGSPTCRNTQRSTLLTSGRSAGSHLSTIGLPYWLWLKGKTLCPMLALTGSCTCPIARLSPNKNWKVVLHNNRMPRMFMFPLSVSTSVPDAPHVSLSDSLGSKSPCLFSPADSKVSKTHRSSFSPRWGPETLSHTQIKVMQLVWITVTSSYSSATRKRQLIWIHCHLPGGVWMQRHLSSARATRRTRTQWRLSCDSLLCLWTSETFHERRFPFLCPFSSFFPPVDIVHLCRKIMFSRRTSIQGTKSWRFDPSHYTDMT